MSHRDHDEAARLSPKRRNNVPPQNDDISARDDVTITDVNSGSDVNDEGKASEGDSKTVEAGTVKKVPPRTAPKPASKKSFYLRPHAADDVTHPHSNSVELRHTMHVQRSDDATYMHIKDRTTMSMRQEQHVFVQITSYRRALQDIQDSGFLVITGPPGAGKSSLSHALLRHFQTLGYTPIILHKYEELRSQVGGEKKMAVLLEDVLEPTSTHTRFSTFKPHSSDVELWLRVLPAMEKAANIEKRVIILTASDAALKLYCSDVTFSNVMAHALNLAHPEFAFTREEKNQLVEKYCQVYRCCSHISGLFEDKPLTNKAFLSQCKQFAESTLPDEERIKIFLQEPECEPDPSKVECIIDVFQPHYNTRIPQNPALIQEEEEGEEEKEEEEKEEKEEECAITEKSENPQSEPEEDQPFVLHISRSVLEKCLASSTSQVGKKGVAFQRLCDINKVLNDSNWTTDGVNNILGPQNILKDVACSEQAKTDDGALQSFLDDPVKSTRCSSEEDDSCSQLVRACKDNDVEAVTTLIQCGQDLAVHNSFGFAALHAAGLAGCLDTVKILLDHVCPVDAADHKEWTALHLACLSGHSAVAEALIEKGAGIEKETVGGVRPLHIACRYGHAGVARLLLQKGADIEAKQGKGCMARPLHLAAFCGHLDVVELLLQHNAKTDAEDTWGWLPLHFACQEGHADIVKLLVTKGTPPSVRRMVDVYCPHGHIHLLRQILACQTCTHHDDGTTTVCSDCCHSHQLALQNLALHSSTVKPTEESMTVNKPGNVISNKATRGGITALYLAAQNGHVEVVNVLLQFGACAEAQRDGLTAPRDGFTALHVASYKGHVDVVNLLLQYKSSVDVCPNDVLLTPLHLACLQGHHHIAHALLEHGASADVRDNRNLSPLHLACIGNHSHLLPSLLPKVKDVYSQQKTGSELLTMTCKYSSVDVLKTLVNWIPNIVENGRDSAAVHTASSNGKVEVLMVLLEHNLSPNVQVHGSAPIHLAAQKGHAAAAQILLRYGATVNKVNSNSFTPLHLACQERHGHVVNVLLEEGSADIEARDRNGRTALHLAASTDHAFSVTRLLDMGADVNAQDSDYKTPLYETRSVQVVDLLLRHRADANIPTSQGDTLLHKACQLGLDDVVAALLAAHANPEAVDNLGRTPLLYACQSRSNRAVMAWQLLERHADVNIADYQGVTPAHEACCHGDADLLELLLQRGADVNKVDDTGETALHKACVNGNVDVVVALIDCGAAVNKRNNEGQTPLHHACCNLHPEVVKKLLDAGALKIIKNKAGVSPVDVVRSMALVPPLPRCPENATDGDQTEDQINIKQRSERRKEILGHFVDSNPPSARSSKNIEDHIDIESPAGNHHHQPSTSESSLNMEAHINAAFSTTDSSGSYENQMPTENEQPSSPSSLPPPLPAKESRKSSRRAVPATPHNDLLMSSPSVPDKTRQMKVKKDSSQTTKKKKEKSTVESNEQSLCLATSAQPHTVSSCILEEGKEIRREGPENTTQVVVNENQKSSASISDDNVFQDNETTEEKQLWKIENATLENAESLGEGEMNCQNSPNQTSDHLPTPGNSKQPPADNRLDETERKSEDVGPMLRNRGADVEASKMNVEERGKPITVDTTPPACSPPRDSYASTSSAYSSLARDSSREKVTNLTMAWLLEATSTSDAMARGSLRYSVESTEEVSALLEITCPLHAACLRGDANAVLHHLSTADINARNPADGRSPLHYACTGGHAHIVAVMLKLGADPEVKDALGQLPLHVACCLGHLYTSHLLLCQGGDLELRDRNGHTPLHLAAQGGHVTVISVLLTLGADVTSVDRGLRTALHYAAGGGFRGAVAVLLGHGAHFNATDQHGDTPLTLAAAGLYADCCLILLIAGADPDSRNESGESARTLAERSRDPLLSSVFTRHSSGCAKTSKGHIKSVS